MRTSLLEFRLVLLEVLQNKTFTNNQQDATMY